MQSVNVGEQRCKVITGATPLLSEEETVGLANVAAVEPESVRKTMPVIGPVSVVAAGRAVVGCEYMLLPYVIERMLAGHVIRGGVVSAGVGGGGSCDWTNVGCCTRRAHKTITFCQREVQVGSCDSSDLIVHIGTFTLMDSMWIRHGFHTTMKRVHARGKATEKKPPQTLSTDMA